MTWGWRVLFCVLLAWPWCAVAQDEGESEGEDGDEPLDLRGEVRVEVIATADAADNPSAATDVVTREDIEASGARSASDALRLVPGVTVEVGSRGEATLQLRGFDHHRTQVLLDGVPVAQPYDGAMDLSSLSAAQIDSIRVDRGAAGSAYGGGALGGVVNITTTGPPAVPTMRLRAGVGSAWRTEVLAAGGAALGPVRVGIGWELRNRPYFLLPHGFPEQLNEQGGRRENSDRRDQSLHASVGIGDALHGLQLRATIVDVRRGVPPEIDDPSPRWWRWDTWRDHVVSLHGHVTPGARTVIRGAGFLRLRNDLLDAYDDDSYTTQNAATSFQSTYDDAAAGGMAGVEVDLGKGSLLETTLSYRHDHHRSQFRLGEEWTVRDGDSATLAPTGTFRVAPPLIAQAGADVHVWQPRDQAEETHRSPVFSADPRAGVVVQPVEPLAVRVSGGRRSRFPTLKEMYSTQLGYVVPNPDLRPESAWSVDGGVTWSPWQGRLYLGATGYVSFVRDLIERTVLEDGTKSYTNITRSRHAGVELRVVGRPLRWLEAEVGYDWLHARNTSEDRDHDVLEYRPEHRVRARVHVATPFGLQGSLVWTLVGPRYYIAIEATGELGTLPAYQRLDLSLRQHLGRGFHAYLVGTNLTDTLYEEVQGLPRPGIEVLGGIEFAASAPALPGQAPPPAGE